MFSEHRHCDGGDIMTGRRFLHLVTILPCLLAIEHCGIGVIMLLVCHQKHLLDLCHLRQLPYVYEITKFSIHRSYRNGDINSYVSSYMNTLEKLNSQPLSTILRDFQKPET